MLVLFCYHWWQGLLYFYIADNYLPQPKLSSSNLNVHSYQIDIQLFPSTKFIKAKVGIKFSPKYKTKFFTLDFNDGFNVHKVKLDAKKINYEYKNNTILFNSRKSITDTSLIEIFYSGYPSQKKDFGLIFGSEQTDNIIYTINESSEARSWFPCHDDPSDKALLDIRITNDSRFVSVSNGNLIDSSQSANQKTYHWKTIYPLTTYNIAIYSADYKILRMPYDKLNLVSYIPDNIIEKARIDLSLFPELLKKCINDFGNYPFPKEKLGIAVNLWNNGAIENQSVIGVGKKLLTGDNRNLSTLHHEIAHAWWGNSVSLKSWKDIWLNEAFASYAEILFAKKYFGANNKKYKRLLNLFDEVSFTTTLYKPEGFIFDRFVYEKGARVLMMLSYEIGDSLFADIIKKYQEHFKYGNSSTEEFKLFLEKYSNKNLSYFFNQWIYKGVGLPVIKYSYRIRNYRTKSKVIIKIEQIQNDYKLYKMKLPVTFFTGKHSSDKLSSFSMDFQMNSRKMQIEHTFDFIIKDVMLNYEGKILAKIVHSDYNSF